MARRGRGRPKAARAPRERIKVRLRFPTDQEEDLSSPLQPGDSLDIAAEGLRPMRLYTVEVRDGQRRPVANGRVLSGPDGRVPRTTLWPQAGLDDVRGKRRYTVEELLERWGGHQLTVTLAEGKRPLARRDIPVADRLIRPIVVGTDENGALQNWIQVGCDGSVGVSAFALPSRSPVRIFVVARQRNWRPGDPFSPVTLKSGRSAWSDGQVDQHGILRVRLATAMELEPGAYDFIVRPMRYGYEDAEDYRVRTADFITRRYTGLVVRGDFMGRKIVRGGCANTMPMSGRTVLGRPYFQYADTFQVGEDIYAALDPLALAPGVLGKMVALYVIQHKTPAQWSADTSLTHLAVLGGNAAVQRFLTQPGCINFNERLVWPDANQVGEYDIVADFGNDTADPNLFAPDAQFDMPNDICDGYFVPGFRVVPDPTTDTAFGNAGSFTYNDGPVTVVDDSGSKTLDRKAVVYFPADAPGATTPGQISGAQANYPLLVIVHGNSSNSSSYLGYNYLLEHWARNGFIAASVHCNPGMLATGRARVLFEHINLLKGKFGASAQNSIGIMGHSRGGEAVAAALRINYTEGLGHNLVAVICLAPSDWILHETIQPAWAAPLQVIYGSLDGDIAGGPPLPMETGFAIYDRASGAEKSMAFVYGAIHDRFNTIWGDGDLSFGQLGGSDFAKVISVDAHHKVALGYMTAFFRRHIRGEAQWEGILTGEWRPAAVEAVDGGTVKTYHQYSGTARREIDTFEGPHTATSWQASTIGGAVSDDATLPVAPTENNLWSVDSSSPHSTAGLLCQWSDSMDHVRFDIPAGQRDVTGFRTLSLRITQKNGSPLNPVNLLQDAYITLQSGNGSSRSIRAAAFGEIPYPDQRYFTEYTKSAMRTVRIPLSSYTIAVINTVPVDLTDVVSVSVDFGVKPTGEIEVDSLEFSN